ncbi:MAX gene-associated protein isoform X2 [Rhinoderma darwinii]|uniref:MAX gene-associated protein isoform X2 n=1 Tax=Rhinoderma darwinii TaxID=43563 RepID=UPI003F66CD4C
MEEDSTQSGGTEGGSKPPATAPAFFVILHPSQGDGSTEQGILVANRNTSSVAPVITTGPNKSKSDFFLSANCTSGEITVTIDNNNMWNEFYRCNTEMVLTKQGRRMFPYCRYWISGLNPYLKYILVMDITPLDNQRYKWNGKWWEPAGKADPHVLGRVFIHPESPSTGQYWMHQPVSFYKLKLTNNILDQDGHIILHSMHRYLPRLHVVPAEKASEVIQLNGPDVHTFTFPQTEFIAVTAYQNFQITQLKIDCNPFAKGFREGTVTGRPVKDSKHTPSEEEVDSSSSKNVVENEDPSSLENLQELFRMSDYLDGDKENDSFNSEQDFLKFIKSKSELGNNLKQNADVVKRFNENFTVAALSEPTEDPTFEVKKEPEDNYDYSKTPTIKGVVVKQEPSDGEVTDDYSNSDVDFPILEKQFAKFKEDPYLDGKHCSNSPTGVAKAKLLNLDQGSVPVLYLEPCAADKNNLEAPELQKPLLPEGTLQDMGIHNSSFRTESRPISPSPNVNSQFVDDLSVKGKRKRICKNKINEIYATLQTALKSSRGPKRKFPLLLPKTSVTPTPGNEGTVAPIAKKRGRPPKPKISKVGRRPKKDNFIEASRLFPDFNPDLEDVDGVLFVAFSSKEALDVHTGKKPTDTVSSSFSTPEASTGLTDEMQKILGLERQLLTHLKTMKYRQVIHPALQQVGLKLNIVDPSMSIDLRYLGVELPLLYITSDTRYDDNGLSAQTLVSGLSFVSRTGKTTDYTKIKGWREKFPTELAPSSQKIEAGRSESSLKNLSAFCSDELDEYLENEAKLMGDLKELTMNEPESSISYQLPTKSSSYVRTLDSVLKKQAQQAISSLNATELHSVPRKKRRYTRRASTPKANSKPRPLLPAPIIEKEKSTKPPSPEKKDHSVSSSVNKVIPTTSSSVDYLSKSQPMVKPSEGEQGGTVQHNFVTSVEDNVFRSLQQVQMQSVSKPIGISKAQIKLLELEEGAVWEGKPRTYITEERADVSLSTLLTAQASLKTKPIQKLINKRTNSCNNEFCRLGCICSSLSPTKHAKTHCGHETCMFSCECLKNKLYFGKYGFKAKSSRTTQDEVGSDFSSIPGYGYPFEQAEHRVESLKVNQAEEHQEISVDGLHDGSVKAKRKKSNEGNDRKSDIWTPIRFPIWNRSDLADDPEPLCIPEQAEFVPELRISHKGHVEKGKSHGGGKPGRPSTVAQVHPEDPVYLYFDSKMTCARVRVYQPKAPEEKTMKDQTVCDVTPIKHDHKSSKAKEREKDDGEDEVVEKKCKTVDNNGPTKLIEIISDCSWEEDESKVLNITSQHMTTREPQAFKLGSFNFELMQENKSGEKSTAGTLCSRVKIAMSADKQSNPVTPRPVQWKIESVKPPEEEPEDTSAEKEAKSHGGKGLPFYSKVIPAGKLVARLKTSDINEADRVEVNGKNYPQAKLLLGQMGALHPANRLAAYITRRLQPSLFHLSKLNEISAKMAAKGLSSSDSNTVEKSKNILTSPHSKTAAQSRPSSMCTQFLMSDVGSMHQKSPGISSPESTIVGSPKLSTQSTWLLFVSPNVAAGKKAPAITTTTSSSMKLPSLSSPSLFSAGSSTLSPSKKKATPSLPTLMRVTKLVTKGSSLSIPAGIVEANDAQAITLTSVPSTKDTVLTPPVLSPTLVKFSATTGNTSSISLSNNPGINKSLATSITTSLLVSPNVPRLGSVASQVGLNIASPMTVKSVGASTVSASSPSGVTPGLEKRLGPQLLLIPVNNASAPARPTKCVQTSAGQKMVLQPIKSANGVTLFRHPNGQIIQLVPLQQVNSANIQPSIQQYVIRNTGSTMGVNFPPPTKPEPAAATSISIPATSIPPSAPTNLPAVSPSKTSPNKSGLTIIPQNAPICSPSSTAAMKTTSPNSEASLSFPQVVTSTTSAHAIITPNVKPLKSGGLSLTNVPPPTSLNDSPVNAATKSNLTLMGDKSATVSDSNKDQQLSNSSLCPLPSGSSEETFDKEDRKECVGQATSEIANGKNEAELQRSTKEPIKSVIQEVHALDKEEQCQNGQQDHEQSRLRVDSFGELLSSDVDFFQEAKKDDQGHLTEGAQGPADKADRQQSPPDFNSQVKKGDSPAALVSAYVQQVAAGVEPKKLFETGEKAESLIEQRSAKAQVPALSSDQNLRRSPQVDEEIELFICDNRENQSNPNTDDESEVDESVDIETVEELSEKINIARLKASATTVTFNKDKGGTRGKFSKGHKKHYKVNVEDVFSTGEEHFRQNHTANERKRRNEMRDLFEELKNSLGLHNLPKVSKSYILKQAIEEIEDLTDTADTLIKKKALLSQTQTQLIKKVSNLSGKPKEVVLQKFECLHEKQKAIEAETKKKNLDIALQKASSINFPLPNREPYLSLKLGEETNEMLNNKTKKPIILARKPMLLSKEENEQQPGVSVITTNVLMAPTGQMVDQKEHGVVEQVANISPTLVQANPAQIKSGMTSVVIQLPDPIERKGMIGNSPVLLSLSTVPGNISDVTPSGPDSEKDDLSMMPRIVDVTSLAQEASSGLGRELEIGTSDTESYCKSDTLSIRTKSDVRGNASVQDSSTVTAESCVLSTSIPIDQMEESLPDSSSKSYSLFPSLIDHLAQDDCSRNTGASLQSKNVSESNASIGKMLEDITDSGLELELKKLSSAIVEAGLDPDELSDAMGDPEDTDETLTSLLNEIEFLNQQLNNDTDDLDSVSDFPESDTASRSSMSKFADGDSSPVSFGRFKEVSKTKENNLSFSPLFMQLEEGEIHDRMNNNEEAGVVAFEGSAKKEPPLTDVIETQSEFHQPPATETTPQKADQPAASGSDVYWRPMPKLAPLGLKSPTTPSDQRVLASKSMPSLASVATRLSSPTD